MQRRLSKQLYLVLPGDAKGDVAGKLVNCGRAAVGAAESYTRHIAVPVQGIKLLVSPISTRIPSKGVSDTRDQPPNGSSSGEDQMNDGCVVQCRTSIAPYTV